jgi:cell division protease FtsH
VGYDVPNLRRSPFVNTSLKTVLFWGVILAAAVILWQVAKNGNQVPAPEISYSEFMSRVQAGSVVKMRVEGRKGSGFYSDGKTFTVILPPDQGQSLAALEQNKVEIWFLDDTASSWSWITNLAPLALLAVLWFFMIRNIRTSAKARNPASASSATSM